MSKFLVTLGASTGPGSIVQCSAVTATINKKPIAVVGDIATHPYGPDTLTEGMPTVLLNGKPVVFSTAKTSKGGTLAPNTTVKISSPAFESYTGIVHSARVKSNLRFGETDGGKIKEKELRKQIAARENEEPVESDEVALESDFAWKQFIDLAESDGKWMFKFRMADIFGKDVSQDAVDKLYDACLDKSLSNPEIQVCENRIYGLMAAYNTKTNKIYVSRQAVEEAIADNERRHKLLVALVEEFGHHVDWLLRCQYDKNVNTDAEGDEGARFAYRGMCRVLHVDFHELQSVPFARARTPEGTSGLEWDIAGAHRALEKYTKNRQYGTDDHVGDFEGFKVENLEHQGGFGHENIQRNAIDRSGVEDLGDPEKIQYLYRGNWLKDFGQLIAPFFFDPLAVMGIEDSQKLKHFYNQIAPDPKDLKSFLEDVVRVLAIREFYSEKRETVERSTYYTDPKRWRAVVDDENTGLIPGFNEIINVSAPYDHCDNPKGMSTSDNLKRLGFNGEITDEEISVDKTNGMKHYLKSQIDDKKKENWGSKAVYDKLIEQLSGITFNRPGDLVKLGGVLHTVQDFYAHSNFAELTLVKVWFDKVVTWCAESDKCRDYRQKQVGYYSNVSDMVFDEATLRKIISRKDDKIRAEGNKIRWVKSGAYFHKKVLYTPVVTGTYDLEDMLATALLMMGDSKFSLEVPPPKKGMEPGMIYGNDLLLLLLSRHIDQIRNNKIIKAEDFLNFCFDIRDKWLITKKYVDEKMPDVIKDAVNWFERKVIETVDQFMQLYRNIIGHCLCLILACAVREYQLILKQQLEDIKESVNGMYPHGDNPSHTMLAKDEASHPVNGLAGEMAITSTVRVLKELNNGPDSLAKTLDDIITHPVFTDRFDVYTREWAKKNPVKVLKCCVYSAQLETIRAGIQLSEKARACVNKLYNNPDAVGANRAAKSSNDEDGISQEKDLNALGESYKKLSKIFKEALGSYDLRYRELDARTFVEFLSLYNPGITDNESLSDALKKIWKSAYEKAATRVKGDINKTFDFIEDAWNQAVAYIEANVP